MTPEIKTNNDGKGRAQSCDASLTLSSANTYWGSFTAKFTGYGLNEWSAKQNLIKEIDDLIVELQKIKENNV